MKNPNKKRGASIIELMVTVAIVGVVAGIAVPNFSQIFSFNRFQEETRNIVNFISDARANAIASKECRDTETLTLWAISIDQNTSSLKLACNSLPTGTMLETEEDIISSNTEITAIEFDDNSTVSNINISFEAESAQAKIADGTHKNIRLVFTHPSSGKMRTLCFNSVAGFPTLEDGNNDFPCP